MTMDEMCERAAKAMLADLGYPGAFDAYDPYKRIVMIQLSSADFVGMAGADIKVAMHDSALIIS